MENTMAIENVSDKLDEIAERIYDAEKKLEDFDPMESECWKKFLKEEMNNLFGTISFGSLCYEAFDVLLAVDETAFRELELEICNGLVAKDYEEFSDYEDLQEDLYDARQEYKEVYENNTECLFQLSNYSLSELPRRYCSEFLSLIADMMKPEHSILARYEKRFEEMVQEALSDDEIVCEVLDDMRDIFNDIIAETGLCAIEEDDNLFLMPYSFDEMLMPD